MGSLFSTPARQAAGWAGLGVLGLLLAMGGAWLALHDDGSPAQPVSSATETPPPATPTRVGPTPTASATPTTQASPTPATAGVTPAGQGPLSSGSAPATPAPEAAAEPTAEPSPEPVASAGGPYCPSVSATATPTRVFGTVTIGGSPAPAATVVTLAFDGVAGPGEAVTVSGGAAGFSIDFNAAQGACANRVGASIGAYVRGVFVASGQTVGGAAGQAGFIRFDIVLP